MISEKDIDIMLLLLMLTFTLMQYKERRVREQIMIMKLKSFIFLEERNMMNSQTNKQTNKTNVFVFFVEICSHFFLLFFFSILNIYISI